MANPFGAYSIHAIKQELAGRLVAAGLSSIVRVEISPYGEMISLDTIFSKSRGIGMASKALRILLELADEGRRDIKLFPHPLCADDGQVEGLNKAELERWYSRHGFVECKATSGNYYLRKCK